VKEVSMRPDEYRILVEQSPILIWCSDTAAECDSLKDVEAYLMEYLNTVFSYGGCPDCLRKHCPGHEQDKASAMGTGALWIHCAS
jgi:hypothetical protein